MKLNSVHSGSIDRAISFAKGKEEIILALIIFTAASITGGVLYVHDNHSLLYFGDAVSHIVRARQFIDSQQPGILNIGTVWLPLPHLLLLPFVAFDGLFYSGTAGAVIGIPLLIVTGLLLFSILGILTHSRSIAFLFALVFALNPNVLYIALTPMNEISLLFFVTLAGFFLLKLITTKESHWMMLASLAVAAASLCRYEAWLLAPCISLIGFIRAKQLRHAGRTHDAVNMILMALIGWSGIVFWFGWNYFLYGDALKFAHWTYSVGTTAVRTTLHDRPQDVFLVLGKALVWIFGPMLLAAAAMLMMSWKKVAALKEQWILLLFFSLPAVFVIIAILTGFVQIDQWWWNWRYVLTVGLFLSTAGAVALSNLWKKIRSPVMQAVIVVCFLTVPVIQLTVPGAGVAVYNDALKTYDERCRSAAALGADVRERYEGGSIAVLTGYGVGQRMMISSRLPIKTFTIHYFPNGTFPAISDRYIILEKDQSFESGEFSGYWLLNKEMILRSYDIRMENKYFVLLENKDGRSAEHLQKFTRR
jgi:hypothetical protein